MESTAVAVSSRGYLETATPSWCARKLGSQAFLEVVRERIVDTRYR